MAITRDTIHIAGDMTLTEAAMLHSELVEHVVHDAQVIVDTSALSFAPVALVQLFYAAHRQAAATGCMLTVTCPPGGAMDDALTSLGFLSAPSGAPRIEDGAWTGLLPN